MQQTEELKLWLCKLPQTGFKLTQEKLEFNPTKTEEKSRQITAGTTSGAGTCTTVNDDDENEVDDSNKAQLMENMAQLWLQQEVKDLETGHEQTKGKYSPYLFVDHLAFINHLFVIKDIVASKKFAVIGKDII